MEKIEKLYTISKLPNTVQRRNSHEESLLFLKSTDQATTKVIRTKFGDRSYCVFNGTELVIEKHDISDDLFYVLSDKFRIPEVKKEVSDIEIRGNEAQHYKYKGPFFGLEVVKIYFDSEEEAANFNRPYWIKGEIKNVFFEKGLGKIVSREKE